MFWRGKFKAVSRIDEDLKAKTTEYSQVVTTIKQRKKRETYVAWIYERVDALRLVERRESWALVPKKKTRAADLLRLC